MFSSTNMKYSFTIKKKEPGTDPTHINHVCKGFLLSHTFVLTTTWPWRPWRQSYGTKSTESFLQQLGDSWPTWLQTEVWTGNTNRLGSMILYWNCYFPPKRYRLGKITFKAIPALIFGANINNKSVSSQPITRWLNKISWCRNRNNLYQ